MANGDEPMEIDKPRPPRRVPLKICPICRVKVLLEARQPLYTHTRLHIEDHWNQKEGIYACKLQTNHDGRECTEAMEDKDGLTDHMLKRHSPVMMVPTTSKTHARAVYETSAITQRAKDKLANGNQAHRMAAEER